jgi:arylsulfatase A-like enzyme
MDELDALGLAEDTVVIFMSDHGDMLGDHGLSQKNVPYEHSARIPLIIRWPGRTEAGRVCDALIIRWPGRTEAGRVCDDPAGPTDILPTLLHGLGLDYPAGYGTLSGESLLSAEGGGLASSRDGFFIDYGHGKNRWIALRTREYKYAFWASGGREELYNLEEDPGEIHNIAKEEPELATQLRNRALDWERLNGFSDSFDGDDFRVFPEPRAPEGEPRGVVVNDSKWADNLPDDEKGEVETFAEAFTRAISKETSLSPEKLSVKEYKEKGGDLRGTPWEEAWRVA